MRADESDASSLERATRDFIAARPRPFGIAYRMYENDPEMMRVPLDRVLGPIGVRRIAGTVTGVDTRARTVRAVGRAGNDLELSYDRLVLASGGRLVVPDFPGARHVFDIDTLPAATALDHHLRRLPRHPAAAGRYTAVVVGAGFTGLELSTQLCGRLRTIAGEEAWVVLT